MLTRRRVRVDESTFPVMKGEIPRAAPWVRQEANPQIQVTVHTQG